MTSLAEVTLSPLQAIAINGSLRTNERVEALNRSVRRIKVRMTRLVNDGLVTTRAIPDGLVVTITGYVAHTTAEGTGDAF